MPDGFERSSDATTRTFSISGTPQEAGDYRFVVRLTGLGSEQVYDTITLCVSTPSDIIAHSIDRDVPTAISTYDAAGRRLNGGNHHQGFYIERRQTATGISTRKVMKQ